METYKIIRFFFDEESHERQVIATGLTLEEAKEHCNNSETSSSTATSPEAVEYTKKHGPWFDGYSAEGDSEA